jgi:glycosyltransferase involved in cell wall biosynthesis
MTTRAAEPARRLPRKRRHGPGRPRPAVRRPTKPKRSSNARRRLAWATGVSKEELEILSHALQWQREPERVAPAIVPRPVRALKILMVGWEYPPHHTGGLGVHSYELTKELARMGHQITFLTPFHGPFTPVEGVTFRWPGQDPQDAVAFPEAYATAPGPGPGFQNSISGYNDWVAQTKDADQFDVIHAHDWFGTIGTSALARRVGRPFVLTIHSTEYDRSLGHPWGEILEREEAGVASADRVIAVSRHLGQQLVERYHADPAKVRVIYNAVRPSDRLAPLEQSRATVLYVGRLAAMKGVDTFLRAAASIAPRLPGALFVVAGEGPEYPRLLTLAAHLGISDRVLFLGRVSEDERDVLLASASVFVLPSVVEPFGIAALEAMAAGVPAVVSKTSGIAEIADSIFAVDFWDTDEFASRIAELLEYPVLRATMGQRGRWIALREGWAERALQTAQVYAEVVRPAAEARP